MAAITSATVLFSTPDTAVRIALLTVRKVTTNDTVDLSLAGVGGLFGTVFQASHVVADNKAQAPATPGIVGTVITFTQAGLANDSVTLLVLGAAPQ